MTKHTKALSVIITLWICLFLANLAFAQGGNLGSISSPVTNRNGQPIGGVHISFCQPLGVSSAAVTSNVAILTMSSNPITAGFVAGRTILVNGFTAGDTYFNGGVLTNGVITSGYTILSVTTTTITYSLAHANAASGTVGAVLQQGSTTVSCAGLSSVYSNPTLVTAATNPTTSDNQGNWNVFAAPGLYYVQFYGTGITTTLKQVTIACVPSGTCTTLSPLVIPGITSGGLSVTSPPIGGSAAIQIGVTGNGTAGATFPAATDTVVELTQSQVMTNKTLTAPVINGTPTGTGIATTIQSFGTGAGNYTTTAGAYSNIGAITSGAVTVPVGWKAIVDFDCYYKVSANDGNVALADTTTVLIAKYTDTTSYISLHLHYVYTGDGNSHTFVPRFLTSGGATMNIGNGAGSLVPELSVVLIPSN